MHYKEKSIILVLVTLAAILVGVFVKQARAAPLPVPVIFEEQGSSLLHGGVWNIEETLWGPGAVVNARTGALDIVIKGITFFGGNLSNPTWFNFDTSSVVSTAFLNGQSTFIELAPEGTWVVVITNDAGVEVGDNGTFCIGLVCGSTVDVPVPGTLIIFGASLLYIRRRVV